MPNLNSFCKIEIEITIFTEMAIKSHVKGHFPLRDFWYIIEHDFFVPETVETICVAMHKMTAIVGY